MTHIQVFYPSDNEDGYISVVCLRERYFDELKKLGWKESPEELEEKPKRGRKKKVEE